MISIVSSTLKIIAQPRLAPTDVTAFNRCHLHLIGSLVAIGTVTFDGDPHENLEDWSVGFLQASYINENWAEYRGHSESDGSSFYEFGRPPALLSAACFDSNISQSPYYHPLDKKLGQHFHGAYSALYAGAGEEYNARSLKYAVHKFPYTQRLVHFDVPSTIFPLIRVNSLTGETNHLVEVRDESDYVTVLAVRGPNSRLEMLRGFYWRIAWHNTFTSDSDGNFTVVPPPFSGPVILDSFVGAPGDQRFRDALTRPQPINCNLMAKIARSTRAQEHRDWAPF